MSGSGYVASRHLQGCSSRLCQLRTVRLAPMSKYWTYRSHVGDMGPVNLVVDNRHELGLCPPASLAGSGEKLGTDSRIGQPTCYRLCREPFFSGAVRSVQICRCLTKGCHVRGPPAGSVRWAYVDWRGKRTCHVGLIFPCRVYIDSNHHDSRIWVTACLWQFSRR
jgi:hypothetical protein